jgi:hypothetical protein
MYCVNCGYKNEAGQAYCIKCGTRLAIVHPTDSGYRPQKSVSGLTAGKKVSSAAALLVLVCFFLPWVTVSCGASWSLSGYDLATFSAPAYATSDVPESNFLLFAIPLAAVSILALVILTRNRARAARRLAATGEVLLSLVGGLITLAVLWYFESARRDPELSGLGMLLFKVEPAFYLTVLSFVGSIVGAILDFADTG